MSNGEHKSSAPLHQEVRHKTDYLQPSPDEHAVAPPINASPHETTGDVSTSVSIMMCLPLRTHSEPAAGINPPRRSPAGVHL